MDEQPSQLPWEQPNWLAEVTGWIQDQLSIHGYRMRGPVEILHQRPWSTFAQVKTDKELVYFKAPAPAFHYEAGVTQYLGRLRPDCSVPLLAVHPSLGWLLSVDAGVTLRNLSPSSDQVDHWVKIMPFYAELQKEMAAYIPDLLSLGMYDRRLLRLPQQYSELLEDTHALRLELEAGLTREEYHRLQDLTPRVFAWCEELSGYGLPETLVHEEVHDANILVHADRYIFTDWSDSSVGHPFFSILVTLRAAAHRLKLDEAGPELRRVREAYLEPWTTNVTRKDLSAALNLAYHMAMITRALAWHLGTGSLSEQQKAPYADYVSGWLQDFLQYER